MIPGAVPFATVYDSGASNIVITVPSTISEAALDATLRQAASNLFKPYRLGVPGNGPTVVPAPLSMSRGECPRLMYLGQVKPDPSGSKGSDYQVTIDTQKLAQLSEAACQLGLLRGGGQVAPGSLSSSISVHVALPMTTATLPVLSIAPAQVVRGERAF